ncbi:hypothetical protein B0A52_06439 [Exophiala mesophila]|uniref:Uncharacterized protein n=1 Tax=Exophiala mesophila TaxID=212818 RepID=A0A438N2D1_EXOME|nr:hypothetical protein B0A52_06439 [Exophiala mesophila]
MTSIQSYPSRVDKALPELPIPKFSIESHRPHTAATDDSCPSPTVHVYQGPRSPPSSPRNLRVPQFRQSRRWAKRYEPAYPSPTSPALPEKETFQPSLLTADQDERILTMREESFDQQRAELKHPPMILSSIDEAQRSTPENVSESNFSNPSQCQPATIQCWRTVKATILISSAPSDFQNRRQGTKRTAPPRKRERRGRRGHGRVALPRFAKIGSRLMQKRPVPPPKDPFPQPITALPAVYGDFWRETDRDTSNRRPGSTSPVPSLHDPEKDSRFSKECMDVLNSLDFNRDWLSSPSPGLAQPTQSSHQVSPSTSQHVLQGPRADDGDSISIHAALAAVPAPLSADPTPPIPNITVSTSSTPQAHHRRPQLPRRISSKQDSSSLATQIFSPNRNHAGSTTSRLGLPTSPLRSKALEQSHPSSLAPPCAGNTFNGPRPATSTDTLAKIEAEVKVNVVPRGRISENPRVSHISSDSKSGPPSIPPERPLPALPSDSASDFHRRSIDSSASATRHPVHPNERLSMSTIRIVSSIPDQRPTQEMGQSTKTNAQLSDGKLHGLTRKLSADLMSLNSLSSRKSRDSQRSSRSFTKHNISGPRAEKVKEMRRRDLRLSVSDPDMQNTSKNKTAKQSDGRGDQKGITTQPQGLYTRPSMDELDQFPAVPESSGIGSRPGSRRYNRDHSQPRQAAHRHQTSKSSTSYHTRQPRPKEILSQSNIFVVVDSDPVTARFRAGAMSPAPSIGGPPSRSASPLQSMKHSRRLSNLREMSASQGSPLKTLTKTISIQSLQQMRSPGSVRSTSIASKPTKRHARTTSRSLSSSSDESQLVLIATSSNSPQKVATKPRKRRRWNSNDLVDVGTLKQTVEELFVVVIKQEEKIRWQADQIQMMIRVMAPINRVRGLKVSGALEDIPDYSTSDEQTADDARSLTVRPTYIKGGRSTRTSTSNSVTTMKKREKLRPAPGHVRLNSVGDYNTASTTPSIVDHTDATKVSVDDASLTDPMEYDLGSPGPTTLSEREKNPLQPIVNANPRPPVGDRLKSNGPTNNTVPLHHPPPVASVIPRARLPEDQMSLLSPAASTVERDDPFLGRSVGQKNRLLQPPNNGGRDGRVPQPLFGPPEARHENNDNDDIDARSLDTEAENQRDAARLSVNHVLTSTEQMDRAIEQLMKI